VKSIGKWRNDHATSTTSNPRSLSARDAWAHSVGRSPVLDVAPLGGRPQEQSVAHEPAAVASNTAQVKKRLRLRGFLAAPTSFDG
jgi:hypothetical protein